MLRYFQKAIRRADLPIKYSEGYHPHQLLSFAMPLGVGVESEGEYLDLELIDEEVSPSYFTSMIEDLNREMATGVRILSAKVIPKGEKNAMAAVTAASYEVWYGGEAMKKMEEWGFDVSRLEKERHRFFDEAESIRVLKKTKKSEKEVDLKPLIHAFSLERTDPGILPDSEGKPDTAETPAFFFRMMVSAGSENNVKPQLVMEAFHRFLDLPGEAPAIRILRRDLYCGMSEGDFLPL